jgi:DNA replication protein DnaC
MDGLKPFAERLQSYYTKYPTDKNASTKICDVCGVIEPNAHEVKGVVYYSPRFCECEQKESQRKRAEQERIEQLKSLYKLTYTWLGTRWNDEPLKEKTFENFVASKQPTAFKLAKAFAAKPQGTLILYGTYGTGKTHLLAAICNEAINVGVTSYFCTSPKLFGAIQQKISEKSDYYSFVERAIKTPLLVLDDLDKAKWSEFREEIYFAIIDERVKAGRPTAISTNRVDELEHYVGGAVCSRLKVGQIAIEMVGQDYREEL